MDASVTELIGLVAGCLTTGSFIPQVIKILKTRDVSGISLVMPEFKSEVRHSPI